MPTRIRALLATRETRRLLEKDPIVQLKASLASELGEDDYYKILESKSVWRASQATLSRSSQISRSRPPSGRPKRS